jgi:trehalose 6-phosphate synthase/phosphatase
MDGDNPLNQHGKLVILANRLPIVLAKEDGKLRAAPSSGGLVTALAPVLKDRGGMWIGWPGPVDAPEDDIKKAIRLESRTTGYTLHPVILSEEEVKLFYEGFANSLIWPLFHDLLSECHFAPEYWRISLEVNKKFARAIQNQVTLHDFLWVHDYHLLHAGEAIRNENFKGKIGFFLHIPFPPFIGWNRSGTS